VLLPLVFSSLLAVPAPLRCTDEVGAARALTSPAAAPAFAPGARGATNDSLLTSLYASGVDFATFLAAAEARKEAWQKYWTEGQVPADALALAQGLGGRWRLLVVAIDGCSDSVNTIPYLARLVALVPSLEMRVVTPTAGRAVQEAHRTPDGRAATPTVIVLNEAGEEMGCWVERPAELQRQAVAARAAGTLDAFQRGKQAWYDADAGASTIREVVEVLRSAAAGSPRCDATRAPLP